MNDLEKSWLQNPKNIIELRPRYNEDEIKKNSECRKFYSVYIDGQLLSVASCNITKISNGVLTIDSMENGSSCDVSVDRVIKKEKNELRTSM